MAVVNVGVFITSTYKGSPGFKKAEKDVKKFRKNVGRAANSVRAFQFVLAGVTISTLSIWGKKIVGVAADLQLLQIRLDAVEGSTKAGVKQFKNLFNQFKNVPFQLDAITDGFVRLRAAGVGTEDANRTITNLVDAVAVFGGSTEELRRATIGFQQVAGKGVLSMEELRQQIGESIPSAMALMSRAAGINIAEFVEKVKRGLISATDAFDLFNQEAEKQFGGFAKSLAFTITGALQGLKSRVRFAIGDLFNVRTDLSDKITAFIKILTDRVTNFINSLDQNAVDSFWGSFLGVASLIEGIAKQLGELALIIGKILGLAGHAGGVTGGKALAAGILGAILFGPVGAVVGVLIAIGQELKNINLEVDKMRGETPFEAFKEGQKGKDDLFPGIIQGVKNLRLRPGRDKIGMGSLLPETIDDLQRLTTEQVTLANLLREQPDVRPGLLGFGSAIIKLTEDMTKLADRSRIAAENTFTPWLKASDAFAAKFKDVEKRFDTLQDNFDAAAKKEQKIVDAIEDTTKRAREQEALDKAIADAKSVRATHLIQLEEARMGVAKRANDLSRKFLDKQIPKLNAIRNAADLALGRASPFQVGLKEISQGAEAQIKFLEQLRVAVFRIGVTSENTEIVANAVRLYEQLGQAIKETDAKAGAASRNLTAREEGRIQNLRLETDIIRSNASERIRNLKREFDFGAKNLINDELTNQVLSTKRQLEIEILEIQQQIVLATAEILDLETNPERRMELEERLRIWREMIAEMEVAKAKVSEEALLEQQLWKDLGRIMEDGVGNAIKGLIDGTKTLKEAMLDMWSSAISAAARYIVKLLIMKALGALTGGVGGTGGGSSFFTALAHGNPFAKGGVFKGNVKPFANGDIIRGPTMFGLAGEAGTEAIMPLKRGSDGKLGVAGGGGDNFTVNIQAIDTQTGAQFLLDNMPTIVAGMTQETALNRGIRRGV